MTDHRRLDDVVLDVDDDDLRTALAAAFAPHHVHEGAASTLPAATRALADLAADLVVVAPDPVGAGDDLHDRLALRPRRWVQAAAVVGTRVVLVSRDDVFDPATCPPDGHDEFARANAVDPVGRARRAGEAQVVAPTGFPGPRPGGPARHDLVRASAGDDPVGIASLVRWAVTVPAGTWHLPGTVSARLHTRHTRLVWASTASTDSIVEAATEQSS